MLTIHNVRHSIAAVFVFIFCAVQLSGCGIIGSRLPIYDAAPRVDVDVSKIHDAIPKVEPLHPYGAKDYVLGGRRYRVLKTSKGYVKRGYASWYGTKFHGNHTSTQERFSLYGMTAASPELPLPSYVQVTNLRNGKKIVVRVNDRGPFHGNRILDLSYAAAKKLGFANSGVAPVKIVAIDPKTWHKNTEHRDIYAKSEPKSKHGITLAKSNQSNKAHKTPLFLQIGAFAKLDNAQQLSHKVNKFIDNQVHIEHKANLYRVQIGPLASATQGRKLKYLLENKGFEHITVIEG